MNPVIKIRGEILPRPQGRYAKGQLRKINSELIVVLQLTHRQVAE